MTNKASLTAMLALGLSMTSKNNDILQAAALSDMMPMHDMHDMNKERVGDKSKTHKYKSKKRKQERQSRRRNR